MCGIIEFEQEAPLVPLIDRELALKRLSDAQRFVERVETYLKSAGIQFRFLAARLSNEYDVFLSVRVMGLACFQRLRSLQPLLYQNICQDGLELLRLDSGSGLVEQQPLPA
jgi:hypothetical protein